MANYIYETKHVRTVDEYIDAINLGYVVIDYPKEIGRDLVNRLREIKDKSNDLLCAYAALIVAVYNGANEQKECFDIASELAKKQHLRALSIVGVCYSYGDGVEKDQAKGFEYIVAAAKAGFAPAQSNLANAYYFGRGVAKSYEEAFNWYYKSAVQNYAKAQCSLGKLYYFGYGTEQSYDQYFYWINKAAEQLLPNALLEMFYCYSNGHGVAKSDVIAGQYALKAANLGVKDAQYNVGVFYLKGSYGFPIDNEKGIYYLELAANQGEVDALYYLGRHYVVGDVCKVNYEKAFTYLQNALNKEQYRAAYYLGLMYENGYYVIKNNKEAIRYFDLVREKIADITVYEDAYSYLETGCCYYEGIDGVKYPNQAFAIFKDCANNLRLGKGMYMLGKCYYEGFGTPKDIDMAYSTFVYGTHKEDADCYYMSGLLIYSGEVKPVFGDNQGASYFKSAADLGHPEATYYLARCYHDGFGVSRNLEKAFELYYKACELGSESACLDLGGAYYDRKEYDKALKIFKMAADRGYASCIANIGLMYYYGRGVPSDVNEAARLFGEAADKGDAMAQYNLAICLYYGYGVPVNHDLALYYFKKAADQGFRPAKKQYDILMENEGETILNKERPALEADALEFNSGLFKK